MATVVDEGFVVVVEVVAGVDVTALGGVDLEEAEVTQ